MRHTLVLPAAASLGFLAVILSAAPTASLREPDGETPWVLVADDVTATVYNAVPSQCDGDPLRTASMYAIGDPDDVLRHRIIAMERTMMSEFGISYGDIVLVEGAGPLDGVWQVQDTMNKRFKGQHKIDFLVPRAIRHGRWEDVRLSVPADTRTERRFAILK